MFKKKYYACLNKCEEIIMRSSSGGVFFEMASAVLNKNGIVYGVAFDKDFEAKMLRVVNVDELHKIQGSKYVKANLNNSYDLVMKDLENQKKVLFSGTPCQIFGLYNYLKKKNVNINNLITIDVICHGTPDETIFSVYLSHLKKKYNSSISSLTFRDKTSGKVQFLSIEFKNGAKYNATTTQDLYYKAFLYNYSLKEVCYSCPFSNLNRCSNITIGDYWGYKGKINKEKGLSLVMINDSKGLELFLEIEAKFLVEEAKQENIMQIPLIRPAKKPYYSKFVKRKMREGKYFLVKLILNLVRLKHKIIH